MRGLRSLFPYLGRYRRHFTIGFGWLVLTTVLGALVPWFLKDGIDAVQRGDRHGLAVAAALLAVVAVARGGCRIVSRLFYLHSARLIEVEIRRDLLDRLMERDAPFFDRHRTGDLLSRFSNDLTNVRMLIGFGVLTILNAILAYAVTVVLLLRLSPSLTLIALIPFPLMLLTVKRLSRTMMELSTRVQEGVGRVSEAVEEVVSGQSVVRAFGSGAARLCHFQTRNDAYLAENLALARLRALVLPIMTVVGPLGVLLVIWFGGRQVSAGTMTLGELVAFQGYLAQLAWPTLLLGWVLTLVQRSAASMERLDEILVAAPPVVPAVAGNAPGAAAPKVTLRGLRFAYGETFVLHEVDLVLPAGGLIGVAGPTGSGKTTLLRLLSGLHAPTAGAILLDGVDLATLDGEAHRRRLAVVPQEGRLFSGTVRENLLYGVPEGGAALMVEVATAMQLDAEISAFPAGYETRVGEGGMTLSGGQRQRLTLARAAARGGTLWLLDDPLSQLDAATARALWRELLPRLAGATTLVASGRVSLLAACDRVIVLDRGRVVAVGSHEELLATTPLYRRLAEQERLLDELERL